MIMHLKSRQLLPPTAAGCAAGVRLNKIDEEENSSITNRPPRPTYPKKKSVLTSEATPANTVVLGLQQTISMVHMSFNNTYGTPKCGQVRCAGLLP
jgi:hypothetical protein